MSINSPEQLKEFLTVYNIITNRCFNACIYDLNSISLIPPESECTSACFKKQMGLNQELLIAFQESFSKKMTQQLESQEKIITDTNKN
ncbi:Tim10/DDP family zinc finger domain-containing protein [Strongyloides ratti]|uniref:Mitochondrial import inner membrane translocase subunit n=1 Tax=Strongyloides ratti TaxID=34506 RepID=A0A090LFH3_STRRB|nr:Tim10/DDP family zinc finger domain-containing protein [Strongyloides ratti]CEF68517.1 Tim10/DDP family zinc finger domain-containing protein [Strongyloides ratti]